MHHTLVTAVVEVDEILPEVARKGAGIDGIPVVLASDVALTRGQVERRYVCSRFGQCHVLYLSQQLVITTSINVSSTMELTVGTVSVLLAIRVSNGTNRRNESEYESRSYLELDSRSSAR